MLYVDDKGELNRIWRNQRKRKGWHYLSTASTLKLHGYYYTGTMNEISRWFEGKREKIPWGSRFYTSSNYRLRNSVAERSDFRGITWIPRCRYKATSLPRIYAPLSTSNHCSTRVSTSRDKINAITDSIVIYVSPPREQTFFRSSLLTYAFSLSLMRFRRIKKFHRFWIESKTF